MSLNDAKLYHGNYVLKQESVNVGTTPLRAKVQKLEDSCN